MSSATAEKPTAKEILASPPQTLHRHETDGHLGGAIYAQPFARYLAVSLSEQRAVDNGRHAEWWRNAYLAARVRKQMMQYPHGGRAYLAILAVLRDGMDMEEAATRCGQRLAWLHTMLIRLNALVAEYQRIGAHRRHRRPLSA